MAADRHGVGLTRRTFLTRSAWAAGGLATGTAAADRLAAGESYGGGGRSTAPARRVVFLFMEGGPSQIDLFDPKPALATLDAAAVPSHVSTGEGRGVARFVASPFRFRSRGESGTPVSELMPHLAGIVDEISLVRSLYTDSPQHGLAQVVLATAGTGSEGPSLGAWVSAALGSGEAVPSHAVLRYGGRPAAGTALWSSGPLSPIYGGVDLGSPAGPRQIPANLPIAEEAADYRQKEALRAVVAEHFGDAVRDREALRFATRWTEQLRFVGPELVDTSYESPRIHELYGSRPGEPSFAQNCLVARRLLERGARFVQVHYRGWDHHGLEPRSGLHHGLRRAARETDQPIAALLRDLRQRGMLDETLVVWAGEFGRAPWGMDPGSGRAEGREHQPSAFTAWLAGGGLRPGVVVGETDDTGAAIVERPVHVSELAATILDRLGIDAPIPANRQPAPAIGELIA